MSKKTRIDNTIIIAFDGLDYELIKEFNLENIKQSEFGKIDNNSFSKKLKTGELFASFITGKVPEEHGIEGLWINNYDPITKFFRKTKLGKFLVKNVRGFHRISSFFENFLSDRHIPDKTDLESDTFFETIENSRAISVPSYNPSVFWRLRNWVKSQEYLSGRKTLDYWKKREFRVRKEKLFSELESDILEPRPLLMCHLQYPDLVQHVYGDKDLENFDKSQLKKMYEEMDELAKEIINKAESKGYDRIIFMSDHGLPEGSEHNKNAFYSCNKELFGNEKPKLIDFRSNIED